MPSEKNNILELNQYMKSDKMPYLIYADIESLINEHIPCGYSMSTIWAFDHIENKHTSYRRKDCMKKFCESLREHAKNITDFEKKQILPLTNEELESHQCWKSMLHLWKKNLKKAF